MPLKHFPSCPSFFFPFFWNWLYSAIQAANKILFSHQLQHVEECQKSRRNLTRPSEQRSYAQTRRRAIGIGKDKDHWLLSFRVFSAAQPPRRAESAFSRERFKGTPKYLHHAINVDLHNRNIHQLQSWRPAASPLCDERKMPLSFVSPAVPRIGFQSSSLCSHCTLKYFLPRPLSVRKQWLFSTHAFDSSRLQQTRSDVHNTRKQTNERRFVEGEEEEGGRQIIFCCAPAPSLSCYYCLLLH